MNPETVKPYMIKIDTESTVKETDENLIECEKPNNLVKLH